VRPGRTISRIVQRPMRDVLAARKLALAVLTLLAAFAFFSALPLTGAAHSSGLTSPDVEVVLTSADLTQSLTRMPDVLFSGVDPGGPIIHVNEHAPDQTIKGFGGAMTDSSAWLIYDHLSPATRAGLMNALFGTSGIRLNFLRVPMGASDFTAGGKPYSYDDIPPGRSDPHLEHFSIRHDTRYIIPALKQALSLDPRMFVLANPWSPPGWMKTNDAMSNRKDRGYLKPSSAEPLADYFVKFIEAYRKHGIDVDAVTPQNEPGQESIYPGLNMSEPTEAAFVGDDLAPAFKAAKLATKIYGYDYGWTPSQIPFAYSLARSPVAKDLAGISTHCYAGDPTTMSRLHAEAPRLDEIVAECSPGIMPAPTSEVAIAAMRNWASALALWNLALNPAGGPVQPPNHACPRCTGIVTVDKATGTVALTRDYYELGQLSKFVLPGAVRIGSNNFVRYVQPTKTRSMATAGLDDVAFQNLNGSRVLVAYNNASAPIAFGVTDDGQYFAYTLAAGATATFVWNQPA
jgi:glucosylceramidase